MPNMLLSESDEDLATSSYQDFVRMFLEDANEETRRCAAVQLLRVLIRQFEGSVLPILN